MCSALPYESNIPDAEVEQKYHPFKIVTQVWGQRNGILMLVKESRFLIVGQLPNPGQF